MKKKFLIKLLLLFCLYITVAVQINKTDIVMDAAAEGQYTSCGENCWCSGDGGGCDLTVGNSTCTIIHQHPSSLGLSADPSTYRPCPTGTQPDPAAYQFERCQLGSASCPAYNTWHGPVCNPVVSSTTPAQSTTPQASASPSPSVACREVITTSPGPGGQQIQLKSLDCSPQP